MKGKYILLPQINGKIALGFMNDFISAIIKLAVQDVVTYADKKIEATKQIIIDRKRKGRDIETKSYAYEDSLISNALIVAEEPTYNK